MSNNAHSKSGAILVINAGASRIEFSLYRSDNRIAKGHPRCDGELTGIGHPVHFVASNLSGELLVEQPVQCMKTLWRSCYGRPKVNGTLPVATKGHDRQCCNRAFAGPYPHGSSRQTKIR